MRIILDQQELQDAILVYAENQTDYDREELETEIFYNESEGFFANLHRVCVKHAFRTFDQQEVIDSVAFFLVQEHNYDPDRMEIELFWTEDEGFTAVTKIV